MLRILLRSVLMAGCLSLAAGVVAAQSPSTSREAAIDLIAREVAKIQVEMRTVQQGAVPALGFGELQEKLKEWMETMTLLSDTIGDNPYIRLESFSLGIPSGVSVTVKLLETPPKGK